MSQPDLDDLYDNIRNAISVPAGAMSELVADIERQTGNDYRSQTRGARPLLWVIAACLVLIAGASVGLANWRNDLSPQVTGPDDDRADPSSCEVAAIQVSQRVSDGTDIDLQAQLHDCTLIDLAATDGIDEYAPAVSDDGSKVAYIARTADDATTQLRIASVPSDPDNTDVSQYEIAYATGPGTGLGDPAWSPAGDRIVFWIDKGLGPDLWVYDAASGDVTRFYSEGNLGVHPAWSPDGTRIAFSRGSKTGAQVVIVDAATGAEVAASEPSTTRPAWSPDGTQLAAIETPGGSDAPKKLVILNAATGMVERSTTFRAQFVLASRWIDDRIQLVIPTDLFNNTQILELDATLSQRRSWPFEGIPHYADD